MSFLMLLPLALVLQVATECTVKSLGLSTASLSEASVRALVKTHYGSVPSFIRSTSFSDKRYSFKEIGYMDGQFGFGASIPRVTGSDDTGSWRKAWNTVLINECKTRHEREPVRF